MSPIKREPALLALSQEHHRALLLAFQCKQAAAGRQLAGAGSTPRAQAAMVEQAFVELLDAHFAAEENLLAPLLAPHTDVSRLKEDHQELQRLRASLLTSDEVLAEFALKLEAHVRWEERELFAIAERALSAEEKKKLAELLARSPAAACAIKR